MQQEWVLDVLTDLRTFAQQNGMFHLSEQLDDTLLVAAVEIAAHGRARSKASDEPEAGTADHQVAPSHQS